MQLGLFDAAPVRRETQISNIPLPNPSGLKARTYQEEAFAGVEKQLADNRSTLLVLPTGSGKTFIFSRIAHGWPERAYARELSGRVLVLAHRDELLQQARQRIAKETGELVGLEQAEARAGLERIVVGSIQTLCQPNRLASWKKDTFGLVICDECFPAGTLVDGFPIEDFREGDWVWSVDHSSGDLVRRKVVRRFVKKSHSLTKLRYGATETVSTNNHPYFVKGRGYVEAQSVVPGDLLCVWGAVHRNSLECQSPTEAMQKAGVQEQAILAHDGEDEHGPRERQNEDAQPNAQGRQPETDEGNPKANWTQAIRSWWKRLRGDKGRRGGGKRLWVANAGGCSDEHASGVRVSELLQDRRGKPISQGGSGGGRLLPYFTCEEGPGCEKGRLLTWVRVDSAESVEPAGAGGTVVYNLEVEGSHTYFANGTLVHNCHHGPSPSYKRVFEHFGSAKLLGVTATPDRADEKAMGQVFESVAFVYEIEDAINDAWLVPIRVRQVFIDAIKLASCRTTAGDLNQGDLDAAMAVEEALHGVVNATIEQAGDRKTIVYTTSVDNATRLAEIFNRYQPNTARDVNGKTPIDTRRQILAGFERGDFQRLVNCGIATEGFDCPPVSCIAQARPTKSRSLHAQIVGRGLRPVYASGFDLETVEGRRQAIAAGKSDCLVLEFTGNSGKHRLSSAVDILGGRYDEDEVEAAKKLVQAKPGMRADEALAVAHAEAEKRRADESAKRARLKATTKYSTRDFSPFDVLGIKRTKSDDWGDRFGGAIATDKQVGYMRSMGIDVPKDCTKTQAMRLIGACQNRKAEGLANYSQVVKLGRAGIDGSKLRWQQAADLCWEVQQAGGRPSAEVVDRILNRERSAGEDG